MKKIIVFLIAVVILAGFTGCDFLSSPETLVRPSVGNESETAPVTAVSNAPVVKGFNQTTTYYVSWDTNSSPYEINDGTKISGTAPSNWYDYTAGQNKWANIKTTGEGNDCYWVWIPRYAYQVPAKSGTAQTINIKFLQGKTNVPIRESAPITNTTPAAGEWVVHPAFANAGNGGFGELEGIWVAKFTASSSSVGVEPGFGGQAGGTSYLTGNGGGSDTSLYVRAIPNVTMWREINVNDIVTVCKNMTNDGNSLAGSTGIDSHLLKNTEWGAAAYLGPTEQAQI